MDYHHDDNQSWDWHCDDIHLRANPNIEDISYLFDRTTPIKSVADFAYRCGDADIVSKTRQKGKEYASQIKRRRILDFNRSSEEITSSYFKSKERINADDDVMSELDSCFEEQFPPPSIEDFRQSEAWLAECLNDTDMTTDSDDGNLPSTFDVPLDANEVCNMTPTYESNTAERPVRSSCNIILRGRKSYMRTPSEVPSSIVYPFDFIKPCGVHGDVTLNDINQLILTPPPPKAKEVEEDSIYPTSAFSGKRVVCKTKIPTQGGKGCITIMRTKG